MAFWKVMYVTLQLLAYIIPFLQKGKGVDMRPIADVERMRDLRKEMAKLNGASKPLEGGTASERKYR